VYEVDLLNDKLFMLNANIFQEETRKITFESLLKYIKNNHTDDVNTIIDLLINSIQGSIEDIDKYKRELDSLLK
jgi:hypothetical protein